jgi:hypothetical protein
VTGPNPTACAAPLAFILAIAAPVRADDAGPTVAFAVNDGWVNLRLHKGDTPVTDAHILVLVGEGLWAEGDTDADGKGSFPKPNAETCQVVFNYSTGSSAPVPLTFTGDVVTPATAVVGGAKPPCCLPPQPARDGSASPDDAAMNRQRLGVFAAVLLVAGAAGVWAYRRAMRPIGEGT